MYLSIIILPLLGSIVSGFFGRKIGTSGAHLLTCVSIITTTILAIVAYFEVGFNNNPIKINLFNWITSESFNITWSFQFDSLTVSMLIPVLVISSLVHLYSIGYMGTDPHNQRFFSYLGLFTFMMIILVTSDNYLLMFVGWEGVGVCSYLLISFWFTRIAANQSSISAFLTNRVGDCLLVIGMLSVLWSLGNLDYSTVFSVAPYINHNIVTIIGICFLIGAMAKSSQVGLHVWLPMAMEGPTPVSALIHAATMVTAGVYLLIRSSPLIEYTSTVLLICLWLGAVTTLFSSLIGFFQSDIKKIIAYSTMSQLGMMVISIGLSSYNIALFHLMNHAFYKGLLFLGAGSVIHAVADNQDLRKYGGLRTFLPLTYTVILIASLSLVAFPYMTGFYSKDFILESAYGQYNFQGVAVYVIAVIGAIFTTLYSVKVLYLTFLTNPNGSINYYKNSHESGIFMSIPLVVLAIFSIYFGYLTKDIYIGIGSSFFIDNSIFMHPMHEILIDTEFGVPTSFKILPLIFTVSFTILALVISEFLTKSVHNFKLSNLGYYVFGFFNQRFLIELFYNTYIVNLVLNLGGQTTKILDKGSIELVGPFGIEKILVKISKNVVILSTSVIPNYALYILLGIISYILIYYFANIEFVLILFIFIGIFTIFNNKNFEDLNNNHVLESNVFFSFSRELFTKIVFKLLTSAITILALSIFGLDIHHCNSNTDDTSSDDDSTNKLDRKGKGKAIETFKEIKKEQLSDSETESKIKSKYKAYYESASESESENEDKKGWSKFIWGDLFSSKSENEPESSKAAEARGKNSFLKQENFGNKIIKEEESIKEGGKKRTYNTYKEEIYDTNFKDIIKDPDLYEDFRSTKVKIYSDDLRMKKWLVNYKITKIVNEDDTITMSLKRVQFDTDLDKQAAIKDRLRKEEPGSYKWYLGLEEAAHLNHMRILERSMARDGLYLKKGFVCTDEWVFRRLVRSGVTEIEGWEFKNIMKEIKKRTQE